MFVQVKKPWLLIRDEEQCMFLAGWRLESWCVMKEVGGIKWAAAECGLRARHVQVELMVQ